MYVAVHPFRLSEYGPLYDTGRTVGPGCELDPGEGVIEQLLHRGLIERAVSSVSVERAADENDRIVQTTASGRRGRRARDTRGT